MASFHRWRPRSAACRIGGSRHDSPKSPIPRPRRVKRGLVSSAALDTAYAALTKTLPAWKKNQVLTPGAVAGPGQCGGGAATHTEVGNAVREAVANSYDGTFGGKRIIVYAGGTPVTSSSTTGPVDQGAIWVRHPTGPTTPGAVTHEYLAPTTPAGGGPVM